MSGWRKAGLTYNTYISIASRTLRDALKPELRTAVLLDRNLADIRFTKYDKGLAICDPTPIELKTQAKE